MPKVEVVTIPKSGERTEHHEIQLSNKKPLAEAAPAFFKKVGIKTSKRWAKYQLYRSEDPSAEPLDMTKTTKHYNISAGDVIVVRWVGKKASWWTPRPKQATAPADDPQASAAPAPAPAVDVDIGALLAEGDADQTDAAAPAEAAGETAPVRVPVGSGNRRGITRKKKVYKKSGGESTTARRRRERAEREKREKEEADRHAARAAKRKAKKAATTTTTATTPARDAEAADLSYLTYEDEEMLEGLTEAELEALAHELETGEMIKPSEVAGDAGNLPEPVRKAFDPDALRQAMVQQALESTVGADNIEYRKDPNKKLKDWSAVERAKAEAKLRKRSNSELETIQALEDLSPEELAALADELDFL